MQTTACVLRRAHVCGRQAWPGRRALELSGGRSAGQPVCREQRVQQRYVQGATLFSRKTFWQPGNDNMSLTMAHPSWGLSRACQGGELYQQKKQQIAPSTEGGVRLRAEEMLGWEWVQAPASSV